MFVYLQHYQHVQVYYYKNLYFNLYLQLVVLVKKHILEHCLEFVFFDLM